MADNSKCTEDLANARILVMEGEKGDPGEGLPKVTAADNGKILKVVDGKWKAVTPS